MELLTQRYAKQIAGVISCFDRILIAGTLTGVRHPEGLATYLRAHKILIKDYIHTIAEPLRDLVRATAERAAAQAGIEIEFIRSHKAFRKEDRIQQILKVRGDHPGLVHIFSAMELCPSFMPWHDKQTHKTTLRYKDAK